MEEVKEEKKLTAPISQEDFEKQIHEAAVANYQKVIDDFENMTFMYVLMCDDRYFFSRKVIIKPNDVHTSNDAKRYF